MDNRHKTKKIDGLVKEMKRIIKKASTIEKDLVGFNIHWPPKAI